MNIHFIGIGGISMSGLASIALNLGNNVSGSDNLDSPVLEKLEKSGIKIYRTHQAENIDKNTDIVVYTAAILNDNPELKYARELQKKYGLEIMSRADFLGNLLSKHKNSIAISGTHGKTSTTSMATTIFINANLDPTISIGGNLSTIGGNYRLGGKDYFITEACEYVNSFLSLKPKYSIILNIELEHRDFFKDESDLMNSFLSFAKNTDIKGNVIANGDSALVRGTLKDISNVVYFGFSDNNDFIIKNLEFIGFGHSFDLFHKSEFIGNFNINVIGEFNVLNATAAIVVSYLNNIDIDVIREGISSYKGVGRRFEKVGNFNDAQIYDDYAHHPSEVKNTLDSVSKLDKNRLITIFQPHTFSRTRDFLDEFANSFSATDILILTDIYPSREKDLGYIHAKDLYEKLIDKVNKIIYEPDFDKISQYVRENVKPGDIVLTMGAGNVNKICNLILDNK